MNTNTTNISNAAIILADIPYIDYHPHQHFGTHFYVVVSGTLGSKSFRLSTLLTDSWKVCRSGLMLQS